MGKYDAASHYWSLSPSEVVLRLNTTADGLSAGEAERRLRVLGPNRTATDDRLGAAELLLRQFRSPLVLILLFGAALSIGLGEWIDASVIMGIVLGSTFLGFFQEFRATNVVAKLRERLALRASVRRDGNETALPALQLVPGDVIVLKAGDLVPADCLILKATDFLVTEASLTGESFPVEKRAAVVAADAPLAGRTNSAFLGSSVRSGVAEALVVETGGDTVMGHIAGRLRKAEPENSFARGIRQFGNMLLRIMLAVTLAVLTVNQLLGRPIEESLLFSAALAVGLSPELLPAIVSVTLASGARELARRGVLVRQLEAIENLGSMDVLCTDKTGTLTEGTIVLEKAVGPDGADAPAVLRAAFANATFETGIDNPLDEAIRKAGAALGLDTGDLRKIDEIPYDFIRRRLTIVVETGAGERWMYAKGAFADTTAICRTIQTGGGPRPLDAAARRELEAFVRRQGELGIRVLAVAERAAPDKPDYTLDDECDMLFLGFLLFRDPPKQDAAATIRDLKSLGVGVKVITGDNRYVAAHLAAAVGLTASPLLTGDRIAGMKDEALCHTAREVDVFAEIDPQQKERIVRALRASGLSVGYLGDGINDAPALHAADVGISVETAVDVARESASIVLLEAGLDVVRVGVSEGRRTFANTLKYIYITTSANFGNMISMALVTPVLPFLPLLAKQILLNNFLSDLPSVTIAADNVDDEEIASPRAWNISHLQRFMVVFGLVSSLFDLLTFLVLLRLLRADEPTFQTGWFVVSLLTELAVLLVLRTRRPALRSRPGGLLWRGVLVTGAVAFALPYVPPLAGLFGLVPLPPWHLAILLALVGAYLGATELTKAWFFRGRPRKQRQARERSRSAAKLL